jgi:hypothetical protein
MAGTKRIDPALCLYIGAHLICTIGNENLREKVPRGNGTLCRLVGIKLKDGQTLHRWKNYYDRKVWTVCASDVEWIECVHYPKSSVSIAIESELMEKRDQLQKLNENMRERKRILANEIRTLEDSLLCDSKKHTFRLTTRTDRVRVSVKPHPMATQPVSFSCKMIQFPVNCNDATTGHKLQGMSKDVVIITSWPSGGLFKNWEYVVLSRVRTRDGLYLFQKISMDKDFSPSEELKLFFQRARSKEKAYIRKNALFQRKLTKLR